jgi:hypothetical protein
MHIRPLIRATFICSFFIFSVISVHAATKEQMRAAPIEQQLAYLDSDDIPFEKVDRILVNRFKTLLDRMVPRYEESRNEIGNWAVKAQSALESYGIRESLLNILEGMNSIYKGSLGKISFKETATMYVVLRSEGWPHERAVLGCQQLLEGISKLKP